MKPRELSVAIAFVAIFAVVVSLALGEDAQPAKPKPYPLKTCLVCDMNLGEMGQPFVFVYQGQEIKVCDKSEKADFDKNPEKYLKKLRDLEARPGQKNSPKP